MQSTKLSFRKTRIIIANLLVIATLALTFFATQGNSSALEATKGANTPRGLQPGSTACPAPFFNLLDHLEKAATATTIAEAKAHVTHVALCIGLSTKLFSISPKPPQASQTSNTTNGITCPGPFFNLAGHLIAAYNARSLAEMQTHIGHVISCLGLTPQQLQSLTSQPKTSQSKTSQSKTSQPKTSQPKTSQPKTSQPKTSQPKTS
jgi:hypothetical protein